MIVKIKHDKVYKITPACSCNEMEEMFHSLPSDLQIFASYKVGAGFFQWTLPGEGWKSLADADEDDATVISEILSEKKEALSVIFAGNKKISIDNVFITPGEEYIFYRDTAGIKDVMLVGWDYKFPAKPVSSSVVLNGPRLKPRQNVIVCFRDAGVAVPSAVFEYKTYAGKNKEVVSDSEGNYVLGNLIVGKPFDIIVKNPGVSVTIVPEKGVDLYEIDLTRPYDLVISATQDGHPADGVSAEVEYQGEVKSYGISGGKAEVHLPYVENGQCQVSLGQQRKSVKLEYPRTDVAFDIHTPVTEILMSVSKNGKSLEGVLFNITSDGKSYSICSDSMGKASKSLPYKQGTEVCVEVAGHTSSQLMDENVNSFVFDIHEEVCVSPRIKAEFESGESAMDYPLVVRVDEVESSVNTDSMGEFALPELKTGKEVKVYDGKDLNNSRVYTVSEDEREFVFTVATPVIRILEFTAQDANGLPLANQLIALSQNGKEATLHLDSNGKATLAREIFTFGSQVKCNLISNGLSKADFEIQLDEDEDEYLIVFNVKNRKQRWKYVLESIFALLLLFMILFFWSFIVEMLF